MINFNPKVSNRKLSFRSRLREIRLKRIYLIDQSIILRYRQWNQAAEFSKILIPMSLFTNRLKKDSSFNPFLLRMHENSRMHGNLIRHENLMRHGNSLRHGNSNVIRLIRPLSLISTSTRISMRMILIHENTKKIFFNIPVNWFN